jgi:hypothetical protein
VYETRPKSASPSHCLALIARVPTELLEDNNEENENNDDDDDSISLSSHLAQYSLFTVSAHYHHHRRSPSPRPHTQLLWNAANRIDPLERLFLLLYVSIHSIHSSNNKLP